MMVRRIVGALTGIIAAFAVLAVAQWLIHYIAPPPPGDWSDPAFQARVIARAPFAALFGITLGYGLAVFIGGCLAAGIARDGPWPAWVVAALIGAALIANVATVPHPIWFTVLAVLLIAGAGWFAGRLYGETAAGPGEPAETAAG